MSVRPNPDAFNPELLTYPQRRRVEALLFARLLFPDALTSIVISVAKWIESGL